MKLLKPLSLLLAILMLACMIPSMAFATVAAEEVNPYALPETLPGLRVPMWDHQFGVQKPWLHILENGTIKGSMDPTTCGRTYTTQTLVDYTKLTIDDLVIPEMIDSEKVTVGDGAGLRIADYKNCSALGGAFQDATSAAWLKDEIEDGYGWRGAAGILIRVDGTGAGAGTDVYGKTVDIGVGGNDRFGEGFRVSLTVKTKRQNVASEEEDYVYYTFDAWPANDKSGNMQKPGPNDTFVYTYHAEDLPHYSNGATVKGEDGNDYVFQKGTWVVEQSFSKNARVIPNFKGWIYMPLDSFYCYGAGGNGVTMNKADFIASGATESSSRLVGDSLSFYDGMYSLEDPEICNVTFLGAWTSGMTVYEMRWVYADITYDNTVTDRPTSPITLGDAVNATAGDNGYTVTDVSKEATIAADFDLGGAEGIRFHVNTVGATDCTFNLSLVTGTKQNESEYATGKLLKNESTDYATIESEEYIRSVLVGGNSVMYYYEGGKAKALYLDSVADGKGNFTLPEDYDGEIYIPLSSFYSTITDKVSIPVTTTSILANTDIAISVADDKIAVKDFGIVAGNTYFAGAYASVGTDFTLNFYASVDGEPDTVSANVTKDGVTLEAAKVTTSLVNDGEFVGKYKITVTGIAFTDIAAKIDVTLVVNGAATTVSVKDYSLAKYFQNLLAGDYSDETKALVVDLLNYAAALQTADEVPAEDLVNAGLTPEQLALGSSANAADDAAVATTEGEASEYFEWATALPGFGLKNGVAMIVSFKAEDTAGWVVKAMLNDRPTTMDTLDAGVNKYGNYYLIFTNIGLYEMSKTAVFTMDEFDEPIGDTFKVSMNAALAAAAKTAEGDELAMINALYRLGASAEAYVASIEE